MFLEKFSSEIHVLSELPRRECCWGRILLSLAGFLFFFGQVFCLSFSLGKCLSLFGSLGFCYRLLSFLAAPEKCPVCGAPASKFKEQSGEMTWAAEHVVGVAQGVSEDILEDLRANYEGECREVGMYLAMARVAHREGYPEIGLYWEKAAYEEAEHAAKFAELLGEVVTDSTKKNLEMRVEAEHGATEGKFDLAKRAKAANLDAIHDTVHEMARDEARHGKAFEGLLKRYFN